jgi:predicted glutamine amidotransferase
MAFVSAQNLDFPSIVGSDFPEFIALSSFHKDGWGIAINNSHKAQVLLSRAPERAAESDKFAERIKEMHGDGGLLHLRWATSGLENCDENTHPFVHGPYSFIHNGDIRPRERLDQFIRRELNQVRTGDTDSERYFYLVLTEIEKLGITAGVQSAARIIEENCTFSSINAMLLTPEHLIVITKFNSDRIPPGQPEDYYQLSYKSQDGDFMIASSGWPQPNWMPLANSSLLIVDRTTHQLELHALK